MENFIVWVDAERELLRRKFVYDLLNSFPGKITQVRNDKQKIMYIILNNRCYMGIELDYEDSDTTKIWAMISKYNTEMVHKYPTLKMST